MKAGYLRTFWSVIVLSVVTTVVIIAVLSDITLSSSSPLLTTLILSFLVLLVSFVLYRLFSLNIIKRYGILGGLLVSPALLFITSLPAAAICLITRIRGGTGHIEEMALIVFIAAVAFISSMTVFTYPALAIIASGFKAFKRRLRKGRILLYIFISVVISSVALFGSGYILGFSMRSCVLLLPLLSALMILISFILYRDVKNFVRSMISDTSGNAQDVEKTRPQSSGLFMNYLLFRSHYFNIISGNLEYLAGDASEAYALCIVRSAGRNYDPALMDALNTIAESGRFSESLRREASVAAGNMGKYFTDPQKNNDMIVQSGITEKIALARAVFFGDRAPIVPEVLKLLRDSDPDICKIGISAVARYRMKDLLEEVIQALSVPYTEKEAFYALKYFGPEVCNQVVDYYLNHPCGERVNVMIIKLLGECASPDSVSRLVLYSSQGSIGIRTEAIRQLRRCGFRPNEIEIERLNETCIETVTNLTKIISFQVAARKYKFLLMEKALKWDRDKNFELLFAILPLLIGPGAARLILREVQANSGLHSRWAAEIIKAAAGEKLRGPLLALLDNQSDNDRLHELSLYFPVREITDGSIAQYILSPDQDVTSIWTKACTLRKVTEKKLKVEKNLLLSFLFNKRTVLQEESALAVLSINRAWLTEAAERIPEKVNTKILSIIEGKRPDVTLVFEKTRFLEMCFTGIPEERLLYLASKLKFSETQDTRLMPDQLTWIVPSETGRSGVYTLSVNSMIDFIFHYSEYTDIFVDYIDNSDRNSVLQIIN